MTHNQHWKKIASFSYAHRQQTIRDYLPSTSTLSRVFPKNVTGIPSEVLSKEEIWITELAPEKLLQMIAVGNLTATAVTKAFLRRAALAQQLVNCLTELLPTTALRQAQVLDDYFTKHKRPIGPLHGLPISLKEQLGVRGLRLTAGYVAFWDRIADSDARVAQILTQAGAVVHARTTVPQTMMHLETDSNLYGVTVSPYNSDLSAGGSSGGEGALVGLRGSCLGIGTDIGGSIRSPAANNGVYGFKPTAFRIPTDGWASVNPAADSMASVIGPLSTSIAGIKLCMKTIMDAKPWYSDPELIPLPWREVDLLADHIKVGIMWNDGVVTPHPPITRALTRLVGRLRNVPNVSIVDWKPYLHDEAWAIISSLYFPDAGAEEIATMAASGEPWRPLTQWMLRDNPCVKKLDTKELFYWQEEREAYRKEYAETWNSTATSKENGITEMVDVILCPASPGVAPAHNTAKYWGYTSVWNLLDYPALVFPVDKVDPNLDKMVNGFKAMTGVDEEHWKLYDPEKFTGLPISLQLVARRFEDEKVISIFEYIQRHVGLPFVDFL